MTVACAFLVMLNATSQTNKRVQMQIGNIQTYSEKLDKSLQAPKWTESRFFVDFKSSVSGIEMGIKSIKSEDPNYNVAELETKYAFYKSKLEEGKKVNDQAKDEEDKKKSEALVAKFIVKDEGMANKVHEKYAGKIMFSSSEISKENPDESKFGNSFSISAPIYLRIFLRTSIYNTVQMNMSSEAYDNQLGVLYKVYLDGADPKQGRVEFSHDEKKILTSDQIKTNTSIGGIFNFNKDAFLSSAYIDALIACDTKLTDGKHTLKIELYPIFNSIKPLSETAMATGEFTLNVARGFVNPSNPATCLPKAVKKDPALEAKYKECVKKYLVNNNKEAIMKSFVLLSSDWEIRKNEITSKPISKTMYGAAGLSYKNGKCTYETFSFTQNWNGSSYSSTIETSSTNQNGDIFCDCLK